MVRSGWRRSPLLLAALLVVPLFVFDAEPSPAAPPQPDRESPRTVTLLTGDQVRVQQLGDQQIATPQRGEGRDGVSFVASRVRGHLHVLPSDTLALIGQGRLDIRLFDITALLRLGPERADLPLLLKGRNAEAAAEGAGATVTRRTADTMAVRQPKRTTTVFWSAISRDGEFRPGMERVHLIGATRPAVSPDAAATGTPESELHSLTINLIGRDGLPAAHYRLEIRDLDRGSQLQPYEADGSVTVQLPPGRYAMFASVRTPATGEFSGIAWPLFQLNQDATVDFDARQAKVNHVAPFDPEARLEYAQVFLHQRGGLRVDYYTGDLSRSSTLHLGPEQPEGLTSGIAGMWFVPDATGDDAYSPRKYYLAYPQQGRMISGFSEIADGSELAAIETRYHQHGVNQQRGFKWWRAVPDGYDGFGFRFDSYLPLGQVRMEYVNTDRVRWLPDALRVVTNRPETVLLGGAPNYRAGRRYQESWNNAVSGPGFSSPGPLPLRTGDVIDAEVALGTDGFGHTGEYFLDRGETSLYREGHLVGTTPWAGLGQFTVPGGEADHRLEVRAVRDWASYSTLISGEWTFRSGRTVAPTLLSVIAVGFAPEVDLYNRAAAGQSQLVPIRLSSATGRPVSLSSLTVKVSFDDGTSWQRVEAMSGDDGWQARISHPTSGEYVALRTEAVDLDGNTVDQTIIRAYALR